MSKSSSLSEAECMTITINMIILTKEREGGREGWKGICVVINR